MASKIAFIFECSNMKTVIVDVFTEFIEVAFHFLLYTSNIYPKEIFESRKKYGVSVKFSIHPQVNYYITNCVNSIKILLETNSLDKVLFCILNEKNIDIKRFIFTIDINSDLKCEPDHYLIKCEQNFRAFCLKVVNSEVFSNLSKNKCTFTIRLYTNESAAISLSKHPDIERFPFIEDLPETTSKEYFITPIHSTYIDSAFFQIYAEHCD